MTIDTRELSVILREITAENVRSVCELKLADGQERYVAPSSYTVAEAAYDPDSWLRAIYHGDSVVGVLDLATTDGDRSRPRLVRLLVDRDHQRQGVGRAALEQLVDHLRSVAGAAALETSYVPGPDSPRGFYLKLGFEDVGRVEHGEQVLSYPL
ncbi:MAG: GNAT family N-acetyltransferase [Solirubrobacteraceae bacterium]